MARKIKRLADRSDRFLSVDQRMRRNPEAWERVLAWWGSLGIKTSLLLTLLDGACVERRQFEERLEARSALKHAGPLMRFLRTERTEEGELLFGDLGDRIERSVQNYLGAASPSLPRHHPGEPWLRKRVLLLTRLLRACGQPWKGAARAIHELLELAGDGDVATAEKIRRYIREERGRDPKFGIGHAAGLSKWFAKSEPVIDLYPFEAMASGRRRSRRPRRQVKNRRRVLRKKTKR